MCHNGTKDGISLYSKSVSSIYREEVTACFMLVSLSAANHVPVSPVLSGPEMETTGLQTAS